MLTSHSLQRFLATMEYPATKDDLLREARRDGLSDNDMESLYSLPDHSYGAAWSVRASLTRATIESTLGTREPVAA